VFGCERPTLRRAPLRSSSFRRALPFAIC
jgi:hypothetical protein